MERSNRFCVFTTNLIFGALVLAVPGVSLTAAIAHEGHGMTCTETGINAMNADIQAIRDGEAKTRAMKEMDAAQEMMEKKNMEACMSHMHNAMDAYEE